MRRALVLFATTAVVFALHCGGDDAVAYGPESDKRIADGLLGTWIASDGTLTITICEDRSLDARACSEAVADVGGAGGGEQRCHVMKSDGTSPRESLAQGGGCDTPSPYASLPVVVSVSRTGSLAWRGEIDVNAIGSDGYGGSTNLSAEISSPGLSGSLGGPISPGKLDLRMTLSRGFAKPDAAVAQEDASDDASDASIADAAPSDASVGDASDAEAGDASVSTHADASPPVTSPGKPESIVVSMTRTAGAEACK